ncbi:MAG TPA: hypothetical protein VL443_29920 [Cyclobacteriaceae bacterium]|jgi:hypothetical protein|nr:hypothetical protein [Cyclobacteriaceae bacterium]
MILRFTLSHDIEGVYVISEPDGWVEATIGFDRHQDFHSLIEWFKGSFNTYGSNGSEDGGRDWLKNIEKLYGVDADINILVEIDYDEVGVFVEVYSGQIAVEMFVETLEKQHLLQVVFTQNDFWTRFINRYQSQVDIRSTADLDGNTVSPAPKFTLPLPSQVIINSYLAYRKHNAVIPYSFSASASPTYFAFAFDDQRLQEIKNQSSLYPISFFDLASIVPFFNVETDGILKINKIKFSISWGDSSTDANMPVGLGINYFDCATNDKTADISSIMDIYIQKNNEIPIKFNKSTRSVSGSFLRNDGVIVTNQGTTITDYSILTTEIVCKKNDAIRIYGHVSALLADIYIWGNSGWDHDSGYDQIRGGQGATTAQESSVSQSQNLGKLSWGGYYDASVNNFPSTIDNEAGTGQAIQAGNWWNISNNGNLGGTLVTNKNVITAKVNNPTNSISDWNIGTLTLYEGLEAYGPDSSMDLKFETTVPDTNSDAFLTHDVAYAICDRIAGQADLFYSDYLGNAYTARSYGATGCGSLLANMKGLHIRGYLLSQKPFFQSMQDWWEGINPILNLGLGYEKVSGNDVIRVEKKNHFYDDSGFSILLSNVQNISRKYDPETQFSAVKQGYTKWQSQAASGVGTPSGIDDPQSSRTWNSRFKKVGKLIQMMSKWVAASLTIETTRRVGNLLSANYTYDDDTFAIALKNNGDGTFTPELSENFSSITGLINSDTRYNSRLTPARNFLRWLNFYAGGLQDYSTSFFKFASGEGNYAMTSTMTTTCDGDDTGILVAENGDFEVGTDFLHLSQLFEIEHYMDWNDYVTLRENKNKAIGVSQTDTDHKKFFIKSLEYQIGTGQVKLQAWAKEPFDIEVIDSPVSEEIYFDQKFYDPAHYDSHYE